MIIVMAGLPGTGKSMLARAIAAKLPLLILDKDVLRAALFPPEEIEYSTSQDDFVVEMMLQLANFYILKDSRRNIILDGRPFSKERQVNTVLHYAQTHTWDLRIIYCTCPDEIVKARLEHDVTTEKHLAANRNYDMYLRMKAQFEPLKAPHLCVDMSEPLDTCVSRSLEYLGLCSNHLPYLEESK